MRSRTLLLFFFLLPARSGFTASGTEGASFLDIPVGGAPAALGSAYSAQANDAYAPVWNPAGLGFLSTVEFTGMHLDYLDPVSYEHAAVVVPFGQDPEASLAPAGIGFSVQYLGTKDIDGRDESGTPTAPFKATFAAYTLAYGQRVLDDLSIGASAKFISEKIAGASAKAYATDLGFLYKPESRLSLAAVIANFGTPIKFVSESDPLPLAARLGGTYKLTPAWDISLEGVYRKTGLLSGGAGLEWRYGEYFSFRGGYNTARIKTLGGGAGVTAGMGLFFWGQEFSYAWLPIGDLGQSHYFSVVFRWSTKAHPDRGRLKKHDEEDFEDLKRGKESKYENIFDFLNDDEMHSLD